MALLLRILLLIIMLLCGVLAGGGFALSLVHEIRMTDTDRKHALVAGLVALTLAAAAGVAEVLL